MFNTSDKTFCGHCGERLPPFGADLGYCAACAGRFRRVLHPNEGGVKAAFDDFSSKVTKRIDSWRSSHWNDPVLAALLSLVFPGAGQVYNGHWLKAVLVFVTSPFVIPWLIGIADAFFSARRINDRRASADAATSSAAAA